MSDTPGPEYYQRIRRLRQAASAKRGQHLAAHRLRAALAPVADQLLAETGHASFLADSRAVANELLARHLFAQPGALPDALTLFLAVGEALHEALSRQARALADRAPPAEAPATGTTDITRWAVTASTILEVRHDPHSFLAQVERFHELRAKKPQETRICLLRRFAGRTPAEVAHLLGQEERSVEDCLALFEQFDLAPQAR